MDLDQSLTEFLRTDEISPAFARQLSVPSNRRALYFHIAHGPLREYRSLLLHLFALEVAFRDALWEGTDVDEDDCFEGIYQCAFLLRQCGDPADTRTLWKAQYLNQDVGELYVGYFVGAGIKETLAFLDQASDPSSVEIANFVREALAEDPGAQEWLKDWERQCSESLENCR
ncbi:MAG: hypothetical protein ACOY82_00460 [Pseudomonadota bacterium]|jgi:hypothetical protein